MAVGLGSGLSASAADLGLGDVLAEQVAGETEEMRKKRMLQKQQQAAMSPAQLSLFGGLGGLGGPGGLSL